jgi:hypothetical protein
MAIKITKEIGTDLGITSEAYLRITNYNVQKGGFANFSTQLYLSQEAAHSGSNNLYPGPAMGGSVARNQQIGDNLNVDLRVPSQSVIYRTVSMPSQSIGASGSITYTNVETEVSESVTFMVPDFSEVEEASIFEFGYAKLKEKVAEVFGTGSYVDC